MNVRQQLNQVDLMIPYPTVDITVASGLNGRRGSYFFVQSGSNPNAMTDLEITGNASISVLIYDVYFSSSTGVQWQFRVDVDSNLKWFPFQSGSTDISSFTYTLDVASMTGDTVTIAHNLNTYDVIVSVYSLDSPRIDVGTYVERLDVNTVNIKLIEDLSTTQYRVLIVAVT